MEARPCKNICRQSSVVALKFISDKEKIIKDFKPEDYWKISVGFKEGLIADLSKVDKKSVDRLSKKDALDYEKDLKTSSYSLDSLSSRKRKLKVKPPFITSTLQQDASNNFNWPSKKTMSVAQALFGHGLITYHRTDSIRVEDSKINDLRSNIETLYGKNYLSPKKIS